MRINRLNFCIVWFMSAEILPSTTRHRGGDFFFFFCPYVASCSSVTASMRRASFFSLSRVEQIVPDSRTRSVSNGFLEGWLALFVRRESLPDHSSVFTADCVDTPLEYALPRLCSLWSALCTRVRNKTIESCIKGMISGFCTIEGCTIDRMWHIEITIISKIC